MMPKITFIGAGSTVFARNLLGDIFSFPELGESTISLFDIDAGRLKTSEIVAHNVARSAEARQTIADTLGIGGIFRGLRTIPVLLDMCRDMEELCPNVTFLQYVNPMAMNCWAINRATSIKTVGLCHSVQGTAEELARDIKVPIADINYLCAGINHMAFYLRFERNGQDLYPLIRQVVAEGRVPEGNRVRYEMLTRLGYFVTESSEHFSEYVPWFIKRDRPDLIDRFNIPLDEYIRRCELQIADWGQMRAALEDPDPQAVDRYEHTRMEERLARVAQRDPEFAQQLRAQWEEERKTHTVHRSHEYGSLLIQSIETAYPPVVHP